ncbi:hypothetical protein HOLleu_13445 [Holothuria leucospilota]|uniref:Uncharacterized protein n=1 Tax=Holothuria leucospilota TaxID=206669 RepID=A0A9Q1CCW5_HOLLE|nr:hypothetical protein HOLleu_13445 [Holothuria leucospilota]
MYPMQLRYCTAYISRGFLHAIYLEPCHTFTVCSSYLPIQHPRMAKAHFSKATQLVKILANKRNRHDNTHSTRDTGKLPTMGRFETPNLVRSFFNYKHIVTHYITDAHM